MCGFDRGIRQGNRKMKGRDGIDETGIVVEEKDTSKYKRIQTGTSYQNFFANGATLHENVFGATAVCRRLPYVTRSPGQDADVACRFGVQLNPMNDTNA